MEKINLGRTGLSARPIGYELSELETMSFEKSKMLVGSVLESSGDGSLLLDIGLPSEELQKRIGHALAGKRSEVLLAGSFAPMSPKELEKQLKMVLRALKSDYLDLCQIHDPDYLPRTGDQEGFYDALMQAKKQGYIRSIGLTTGSADIAVNGLEYGWYDTLQYPWSSNSEQSELDLIDFAHEAAVGTISAPTEELPKSFEEADEKIARFIKQHRDHLVLLPLNESLEDVVSNGLILGE